MGVVLPPSLPSPIRSPGHSRGEATRTRLLEAAHDLFMRHGFHGTSMRDIAEAADLAVGGIYNHYRDKEQVFAAVLDAYHPYHVVFPALEQTEGETVEDFLRAAMRLFRENIAGVEDDLMPLVFIDLVEFQGRHLRAMVLRLMPTLLRFLERFSGRRGRLRRIHRLTMMRTLFSLLVGYLITGTVLKNTPLLAGNRLNWFDDMVDIYLHGIVAAEA